MHAVAIHFSHMLLRLNPEKLHHNGVGQKQYVEALRAPVPKIMRP